jgi:hypothetical protein
MLQTAHPPSPSLPLPYSLPSCVEEGRYVISARPETIAFNCDGSRLSVVDTTGNLTLVDTTLAHNQHTRGSALATQLSAGSSAAAAPVQSLFERPSVWDVCWAADDPGLFATLERGRMYIFRGVGVGGAPAPGTALSAPGGPVSVMHAAPKPEEPVGNPGYICSFADLTVRTAFLDQIFLSPEAPAEELVATFDSKTLRDTAQLIASVPLADVCAFIEETPHPRLWRAAADAALQALDFTTAERAFVQCRDYVGVQFVKRLKLLTDEKRQNAEVATYFGRFDAAEELYLAVGRADMARELRAKLGDWFKVVQVRTRRCTSLLPFFSFNWYSWSSLTLPLFFSSSLFLISSCPARQTRRPRSTLTPGLMLAIFTLPATTGPRRSLLLSARAVLVRPRRPRWNSRSSRASRSSSSRRCPRARPGWRTLLAGTYAAAATAKTIAHLLLSPSTLLPCL